MIENQEDYDNLLSLVRGENRKCLEDLVQIEDLEEFSILLCQIFQVGIYEGLIEDLVELFLFFHDKVDFAVEAAILSLEEILEERTCPRIRWSETIELMTALLNLEYKTNQGTVERVDKRGKIMEFIAKFILQEGSRITFSLRSHPPSPPPPILTSSNLTDILIEKLALNLLSNLSYFNIIFQFKIFYTFCQENL